MKKNKIEFSKIILTFAALTDVLITLYACYMIYVTRDTTLFAYIIPAKAAEVATGTGFYYNKAKLENSKKIAMSFVDVLAEKYGMETVVQLLDRIDIR